MAEKKAGEQMTLEFGRKFYQHYSRISDEFLKAQQRARGLSAQQRQADLSEAQKLDAMVKQLQDQQQQLVKSMVAVEYPPALVGVANQMLLNPTAEQAKDYQATYQQARGYLIKATGTGHQAGMNEAEKGALDYASLRLTLGESLSGYFKDVERPPQSISERLDTIKSNAEGQLSRLNGEGMSQRAQAYAKELIKTQYDKARTEMGGLQVESGEPSVLVVTKDATIKPDSELQGQIDILKNQYDLHVNTISLADHPTLATLINPDSETQSLGEAYPRIMLLDKEGRIVDEGGVFRAEDGRSADESLRNSVREALKLTPQPAIDLAASFAAADRAVRQLPKEVEPAPAAAQSPVSAPSAPASPARPVAAPSAGQNQTWDIFNANYARSSALNELAAATEKASKASVLEKFQAGSVVSAVDNALRAGAGGDQIKERLSILRKDQLAEVANVPAANAPTISAARHSLAQDMIRAQEEQGRARPAAPVAASTPEERGIVGGTPAQYRMDQERAGHEELQDAKKRGISGGDPSGYRMDRDAHSRAERRAEGVQKFAPEIPGGVTIMPPFSNAATDSKPPVFNIAGEAAMRAGIKEPTISAAPVAAPTPAVVHGSETISATAPATPAVPVQASAPQLPQAQAAPSAEMDAMRTQLAQQQRAIAALTASNEALRKNNEALMKQNQELAAAQGELRQQLGRLRQDLTVAMAEAKAAATRAAAAETEAASVREQLAAAKGAESRPQGVAGLSDDDKQKLKPILDKMDRLSDGKRNDDEIVGERNKFLTSHGTADVWEKTRDAIKADAADGKLDDVKAIEDVFDKALKDAKKQGDVRTARGKHKGSDRAADGGQGYSEKVKQEIHQMRDELDRSGVSQEAASASDAVPAPAAASKSRNQADLADKGRGQA